MDYADAIQSHCNGGIKLALYFSRTNYLFFLL